MSKIFILSPAKTTGKRAEILGRPQSGSELARKLQRGESFPVGTVFSFLSGLYFRGKMAYVERFAEKGNAFVITSNQGLISIETPISLPDLHSFSEVEIDFKNEEYRRPLEIDLAAWSRRPGHQFVLLGSIASPKYSRVLLPFLKENLFVPRAFPGLGDMSRGALMLKHVREGVEMDYVSLQEIQTLKTSPASRSPKRA